LIIFPRETIDEIAECRESHPHTKRLWHVGSADENDSECVNSAAVSVKPHRHTSVFSYFSPFSTSTRRRTRSSDTPPQDEDENKEAPPVWIIQQLLNSMRGHSMRVLPTEPVGAETRGELKRNISVSTVSVTSGFAEVSASAKSAPSHLTSG
jgi:hypothetical protein